MEAAKHQMKNLLKSFQEDFFAIDFNKPFDNKAYRIENLSRLPPGIIEFILWVYL